MENITWRYLTSFSVVGQSLGLNSNGLSAVRMAEARGLSIEISAVKAQKSETVDSFSQYPHDPATSGNQLLLHIGIYAWC